MDNKVFAQKTMFSDAVAVHASETLMYVRCCVCKEFLGTKPGLGQTGISDTYCPPDLVRYFGDVANG